eukprot:scaffold58128_cov44-Prasinocladus_malaysianus.AAC.1
MKWSLPFRRWNHGLASKKPAVSVPPVVADGLAGQRWDDEYIGLFGRYARSLRQQLLDEQPVDAVLVAGDHVPSALAIHPERLGIVYVILDIPLVESRGSESRLSGPPARSHHACWLTVDKSKQVAGREVYRYEYE